MHNIFIISTYLQLTSIGDEEPIAALAVKLPRFWQEDPWIWFKQVEAQFALWKIAVDLTKYHHVVVVIDWDTTRCLRDIVINPQG